MIYLGECALNLEQQWCGVKVDHHNISVGKWGEAYAERYLMEQGYQTLDRNYHTPYGEIDLIMKNDNRMIFIEVKTRTSHRFGAPELAVTSDKKAHMVQSAQAYLQAHPEWTGDWQIDVVAITRMSGQESPEVIWFENAVT